MINKFVVQTRELTITPNPDGTHTLRVVTAARPALEFTCHLEPFLTAEIDIDNSSSQVTASGQTVMQQYALTLNVLGTMKRQPDGTNYTNRVLKRDDCGKEIE